MAEPIKQIKSGGDGTPTMGKAIENMNDKKRKITRSILNNTGIIVGVFLVFVVIVVFTTDIKLTSAAQWTELGLTFFVLLFCSYSMYINSADSGTKAGKLSDTYIDALTNYDEAKQKVVDNKQQGRLREFCRFYMLEELKNARHTIITEVGVDYDLFMSKYLGQSKATVNADNSLSEPQKKAINRANKIKPIKLTPEMFFKRGRGGGGRNPLGEKPTSKKGRKFVIKFVTSCAVSILMGVIVLDMVVSPTWATFAACMLKLMPVILNWFTGYKMGYENIVYDTVNYMSDQTDLIRQFDQYVTANPEPVLLDAAEVEMSDDRIDNPDEDAVETE